MDPQTKSVSACYADISFIFALFPGLSHWTIPVTLEWTSDENPSDLATCTLS
jgi:hypothetical protein